MSILKSSSRISKRIIKMNVEKTIRTIREFTTSVFENTIHQIEAEKALKKSTYIFNTLQQLLDMNSQLKI